MTNLFKNLRFRLTRKGGTKNHVTTFWNLLFSFVLANLAKKDLSLTHYDDGTYSSSYTLGVENIHTPTVEKS